MVFTHRVQSSTYMYMYIIYDTSQHARINDSLRIHSLEYSTELCYTLKLE
jgi:hypothetical protein